MKTEHTLAAATLSLASPFLGDYAIILIVSLFGALGALSLRTNLTRFGALLFIFRAVSIATVMTSLVSLIISRVTDIEISVLLAPVAFVLAWLTDRWPELLSAGADWATSKWRPKA